MNHSRPFEFVDELPPKQPSRTGRVVDARRVLRRAATHPNQWVRLDAFAEPAERSRQLGQLVQRLKDGPCPRGEWEDWDVHTRSLGDRAYIFARFNLPREEGLL